MAVLTSRLRLCCSDLYGGNGADLQETLAMKALASRVPKV